MNQKRAGRSLALLLLFLSSFSLFAQERTVTGVITNQENLAPLEGVTVTLKGTTKRTTTNTDGRFTLSVPSNESVLVVSYVGFSEQEVKVGSKTGITVSLIKVDNKMNDVIVVGYGTKRRVNVQGAVSTIKAADIEDLPVANIGSALVNRVPGVSVNFQSGKPGSTTEINIRNSQTLSTFSGLTSQPLYVIDGIVVNPTIYNQSPNPDFFENLDASQIEDITFLKDASAAIYGAAGAKGVILITTKKGKIGKPRLSYSGYLGTSTEAVKPPKTLTAYEHAKFLNDGYALNNRPIVERFSDADLALLREMPDRTWYDDLWHSGKVQRHTLNVSGGSDRVTFFAGGSFYKETGNYGDIKVSKYSLRSGMDAKIIEGLTANISVSTDFNEENRNTLKGANAETDDLSIRALYLTPKWVPLTINGQPTFWNGPNPPGNWNMQALFNSGNYTRNRSQGLSVNASLEYKPAFLKGLTAKVQFGKLNRTATDKQYYPAYTVTNFVRRGPTANGNTLYTDSINATTPTQRITNNDQLSEGSTVSGSYQLIGTLSYAQKIRDHEFSVLVGTDQSEADSRNLFLTKLTQLVAGVDEFWAWSNDFANYGSLTDIIRNPQATQFAKRSGISRADYSFKNKYFVEFTGRYDASSNFSPDNRWGFFPTVGVGWKVSDENFMKDFGWLTNLKLRATYGMVGEDRLSNKTYVSRFTQTTGYLFGNTFTNGLDPNIYPNPDATWEKARSFNFGFDAAVLNNKLTITADFYQRYTFDAFAQLDAASVPLTSGLINPVKNYGRQLAWGSEFAVGYRDNFSRDLNFNVDVNFGWSNGQLLQNYYTPINFGLFGSNGLSNPIGKDPRTYNGNNYGYIATGILRSQEEVDALLSKNPNYLIGNQKPQVGFMNYEDINRDGKIDDNDVTLMYGRTTPDAAFGITFGLTYKQFKLQTNMNLVVGGKRLFDSEARKVPTINQNGPAFWNDHWTPENPDAKYPRADAPLIREASTFWAVNGTSARINNMVLSYSLPKALSERFKIPNMRVMLSGTNLWTLINPLKYKDPYTGNFASYPTLRTINLGLNVGL
ncbi:SusC/RagA family TonB-linked outer membrane protein [Segetibacter sp. 3557_3]|uniref:SusC/RagA family TonB-linked outer membrane protein n=1 Tax=Segetibacter sp. 3557_3 TaxID=2547429 RepID=UPI001058D37B|nr:SusC/RagA family TonB-linked outer membrane protein [Segetibacter sp. 3557_3]TDH27443.1 SusC/RagA family TonB-linked outer membrane protein [Segetibacter sp. 3557_3]